MKILIDTYVLMAFLQDKPLPKKALLMLDDTNNEIYYSAISLFEISLKHKLYPNTVPKDEKALHELLLKTNLTCLAVRDCHIDAINETDNITNPYSKIILSQSICENMTLITHSQDIVQKPFYNVIIV